jgi:hypothetical protein
VELEARLLPGAAVRAYALTIDVLHKSVLIARRRKNRAGNTIDGPIKQGKGARQSHLFAPDHSSRFFARWKAATFDLIQCIVH